MRVVVATENHGKLLEFQEALAPLGWELLDLSGFGLTLPPEDGTTYEENSGIKATFTAQHTGLIALADDSGLEVEALGGRPGVYSARFGGKATASERNTYLLEQLQGVPAPRQAKFVSVITLAYPDGRTLIAQGEVEGELLEELRGAHGFGYDPLFYVPHLGKTFAELSTAEKRPLSHRGRALQVLLEMLEKRTA